STASGPGPTCRGRRYAARASTFGSVSARSRDRAMRHSYADAEPILTTVAAASNAITTPLAACGGLALISCPLASTTQALRPIERIRIASPRCQSERRTLPCSQALAEPAGFSRSKVDCSAELLKPRREQAGQCHKADAEDRREMRDNGGEIDRHAL